jgi:hypothetical protein
VKYGGPDWRVIPAYDPNPVAYNSGIAISKKRLTVDALLVTSNDWDHPNNTLIRFRNSLGYDSSESGTTASHDPVSGPFDTYDELTVTGFAAADDFAAGANYFSAFDLIWEISINGGVTWIQAGASSNPLYLTFRQPTAKLFRTVLHIGSTTGGQTVTEVFDGIWGVFADRTVKRWDGGEPLKYYETENGSNVGYTDGLLAVGEGQCHAWVTFFMDTVKAQGLAGLTEVTVEATDPNALGILVNAWNDMPAGGVSDADDGFGFDTVFDETEGKDGLAGQGMTTPSQKMFRKHFIVSYTVDVLAPTRYFDPSYGLEPSSPLDWESTAIYGVSRDGHLANGFPTVTVKKRPANTTTRWTTWT